MSRGTPDPACCLPISRTGLSPCLVGLPSSIPLCSGSRTAVLYPAVLRTSVWAPSLSLAATQEIDVSFFSSGYLDVSVHRVPPASLYGTFVPLHDTVHGGLPCGSPHSDIRGSMDICSSPRLFAAYHVFHRLLVPRHPPCALIRLTFRQSFCSLSLGTLFPVSSTVFRSRGTLFLFPEQLFLFFPLFPRLA